MRKAPGYFLCFVLVSLFISFQQGCFYERRDPKTAVCQFSSMDALEAGQYGGWVEYRAIAEKGDFGIGTVDRLDGEMIALDGSFYRIASDGRVNVISPSTLSPFATVTFFRTDMEFAAADIGDYAALTAYLDRLLTDKEALYAIRVDGSFDSLKTRSVPAQDKPFPALQEALKKQTFFLFKEINGSMIGFRFPDSCRGVNKPGYHFHFISSDRSSGGHVLELSLRRARVLVSRIYALEFELPGTQYLIRQRLR
ncbi:MAG: acetolactate decarboxylase [Candidatus Omnitrophica bacterium]|nr:acetolactate decarboxylase [Candidatus Omnitrophota bacterium]